MWYNILTLPPESRFLDFARNEHGYVEALLVNEGLCLPQSQLYSKMRVPNFSNS